MEMLNRIRRIPRSLPGELGAVVCFSLVFLIAPAASAHDCDPDITRYCPGLSSASPILELVDCMEPYRNRLSRQCVKAIHAHPLLSPYAQYVSSGEEKTRSGKTKLARAHAKKKKNRKARKNKQHGKSRKKARKADTSKPAPSQEGEP